MLTITVNLDKFKKAMSDFPAVVTRTIQKEMKHQLVEIQRTARHEHRHKTRTGTLNDSIDWELDNEGLTGKVGFNSAMFGSQYGPFVHEGHGAPYKSVLKGFPYVWKPDRFLDNALKRRESSIQIGFEDAIRKAVAEL